MFIELLDDIKSSPGGAARLSCAATAGLGIWGKRGNLGRNNYFDMIGQDWRRIDRIVFFWFGSMALGVIAAGIFFSGCRPVGQTAAGAGFAAEPALLGYFREMPPGDTLYVDYETVEAEGDTIPVQVLWAGLDSLMLEKIAFGADSTSMVALGRGRWMQDSTRMACLIKIDQYWWRFQYLLIYDRQAGAFTSIQPLSEFYGGESGQIATVSWLLGDRIVMRSSEHFIEMMDEDEGPQFHFDETAALWEWRDGAFQPAAVTDTAAVVKDWVVEWGW